jgi:hypothetical protein
MAGEPCNKSSILPLSCDNPGEFIMTLKMLSLAAAVALAPVAAFAQASNTASVNESRSPVGVYKRIAPQPNNSNVASGTPARDGCVNVPGEAHNSADCSKIDASDYNTARNQFSTDLSGRPTGATENAERNARILSGQSLD